MSLQTSSFSLEELKVVNQTIDRIYSGFSNNRTLTDLMMDFLQNLKTQVYFDKGNFLFFTYHQLNHWYEVNSFTPMGWDPQDIKRYIDTYVRMDDVLPILMGNKEIAFRNEDIFSLKARKRTRYYQEFVETSHIQTSIDANIRLPENLGMNGIIGFFRDPGKRGFSDKELAIVKTYQPHLSNAISRYMEQDGFSSFGHFFNMLDSFESFGLCIIDETFKLVSFNSTYKKFCCAASGSTIEDNLISIQLLKLCGEISKTPELQKIGPIEIANGEEGFFAEVAYYNQESLSGKYIGLIYSCSDFFIQRVTRLKEKYKLSNREFEIIFLILKDGLTNDQIAAHLFISSSTVKKHISAAYQKIGIKTQKQLLSLLRLI